MAILTAGLRSSLTDEWSTPQDVFDALDREFHFNCDVCASLENAKCAHYYDLTRDGLTHAWHGVCWMNPPYGRRIGRWVAKAREEAEIGRASVVCLLPARTDTRWFHENVLGKAEIRFIKGRLKFSGSKNSAPFPSLIAVYRRRMGEGMGDGRTDP